VSKVQSIGGQTLIGNLNRVFHCNHYNAHLQMSILMSKGLPGHDAERLLVDAVAPLIVYLKQQGYTDAQLLHEFSYCGFGKLHKENDKIWACPSSHYGQSIYAHGKPQKTCFFNAGFIEGITEKLTEEVACQSLGEHEDLFEISENDANTSSYFKYDFAPKDNVPERFQMVGGQGFDTDVDEAGIIATVGTLPLYGSIGAKGDGLIHAFGVVLTNHFADYYNRISYETFFAMKNAGIPLDEVCEVFIQSGHVCAFNTFGGIMSSPEWAAAIEPMCKDREDWFHGMVAVINALGWGTYRIEKLDVEQTLIMRIYNSYEGVGYRRLYPPSKDKEMSFLAMGGVLGLVHLLWKVDIREKPELSHDFYTDQFNNHENSYQVEQTHAIAAGDDYDRIVVTR